MLMLRCLLYHSSMSPTTVAPAIDWDRIDTVFLDMDGTLLDLAFDNYFWLELVPARYADANGLTPDLRAGCSTRALTRRPGRSRGTASITGAAILSSTSKPSSGVTST
jgi:hypothetical protein